MTRARDVADTQDNLGGAVAPVVSGKNFAINGGFDIFQRSTFNSQTSSAYTLDRWYAGVGGTVTITQQTTGAPVGSQFCMRVAYNAASSFANQFQALESGNVTALAGQTVTATVLVRANASWAATSGQALGFSVQKNSTANTLIGGTWSTISGASVTGAAIATGTSSSSWTKLTVTCVIPNDGTAAGLRLVLGESVAGPSGAYWEMAQCQLEIGAVATPFARAGGSIGGELALCQRYYVRSGLGNGFGFIGSQGFINSATAAFHFYSLPVPMRVKPSSVDFGGTLGVKDTSNVTTTVSNIALSGDSSTSVGQIDITSSGMTSARCSWLVQNNSSTAYIGFSAEL
jgi:hypothetical protein